MRDVVFRFGCALLSLLLAFSHVFLLFHTITKRRLLWENGLKKSWIDFGSDGWGFHGPVCYIYSNAHPVQDGGYPVREVYCTMRDFNVGGQSVAPSRLSLSLTENPRGGVSGIRRPFDSPQATTLYRRSVHLMPTLLPAMRSPTMQSGGDVEVFFYLPAVDEMMSELYYATQTWAC
jgi:hypothetical protein